MDVINDSLCSTSYSLSVGHRTIAAGIAGIKLHLSFGKFAVYVKSRRM